jgi:hypothetical protein
MHRRRVRGKFFVLEVVVVFGSTIFESLSRFVVLIEEEALERLLALGVARHEGMSAQRSEDVLIPKQTPIWWPFSL